MNNDATFDLKAFQSAVFRDFDTLKLGVSIARLSKEGPDALGDKVDLSFSPAGLATRGCLGLFFFFGRRMDKNAYNKPDFIEKKRKAAKIASEPKIKKILRPILLKNISSSMFTEAIQARMVRIVTVALTREEIAEEFSIEKDVKLFSLILNEIWQKGISKYCDR